MSERQIYLQSLNIHNFRHGEENPKVVGFINYTPKSNFERPCFKVEYESDHKIDYIAHSEMIDGNWRFIE